MTQQIELELDLARNMFGKLKEATRKRLRAVVKNPTQKTWDNAYSIIIGSDGWMTLWQAVCKLDSSFANVGPVSYCDENGREISREPWKKIPSRELIIKAIQFATH